MNELNLIIRKIEKEISAIKEYREALITDLVTGKRSIVNTFEHFNKYFTLAPEPFIGDGSDGRFGNSSDNGHDSIDNKDAYKP